MTSADSAFRTNPLRAEMNSRRAESATFCSARRLPSRKFYPDKYTQKQYFPVPVFPG